ncbi:MAG: helix-turn-helix transcriptional regulator [Methanoregula sp.]|jgi:putative transcriptional regulator
MKNKIKVYRAMHDMTQEDLAKVIGVTRQTILAIEKGKYVPSLDLAFKIARHFNVTVEDVFQYGDVERTIDID